MRRPPVHKGWSFDWKEFIEKDWNVRRARARFEATQKAARSKELREALARRRAAEAQVAASVSVHVLGVALMARSPPSWVKYKK